MKEISIDMTTLFPQKPAEQKQYRYPCPCFLAPLLQSHTKQREAKIQGIELREMYRQINTVLCTTVYTLNDGRPH